MKRMKSLAALALAATMTLGMSTTVMAATKNSADITINNAEKATIKYVQAIQANTTTETGWDINDDYASIFETTLNVTTEQDAIKAFIADDLAASTEAAILDQIAATITIDETTESDNLKGIEKAGLYVIKAVEDGYSYDTMSAYIGFGEVENYDYPSLMDATINAKKADIIIDKTNNENNFVEIDEVVTYTLTTTVPFFSKDQDASSYTITDTITGADYDVDEEGKLTLTYKIGDAAEATTTVTPANGSFTLKMMDIVGTDNALANQKLVISYSAKVTAQVVENTVIPAGGDHIYKPAVNTLYSGDVTIKKYAVEVENNVEKEVVLAGAEFVLYKEVVNEDNTKTPYYAVAKANGETGYTTASEMVVDTWTTDIDAASRVITNENGLASVAGLDNEETYKFAEVVAPTGYSVNTTDVQVTWGTVVTNNDGSKSVSGTTSMMDTRLSALPSTGGIGTTIFTIAGVAIMVLAAGLFFVSRRKNAR